MMTWVAFAEEFPVDLDAYLKALNELNGGLASKSVLVGGGLTPSEADICVFAAVYSSVVCIFCYSILYLHTKFILFATFVLLIFA